MKRLTLAHLYILAALNPITMRDILHALYRHIETQRHMENNSKPTVEIAENNSLLIV